jgi:hypothetical protein
MIRDSSIRKKWPASFAVVECLLFDAEAPLSVDRRNLRDRKILGIKNAIRHCINHPDSCYAEPCFAPRQGCGAL